MPSRPNDVRIANPACPIHQQPAVVGVTYEFDVVQKPRHYNSHPSGIEAIDVGRHLTADWFNAFKYIFRCDLKNGRQDIEKALWYAEDGVDNNIPMHAPTWSMEQTAKINDVIFKEPNRLKAPFYAAVRDGHTVWAKESIERILAATPE